MAEELCANEAGKQECPLGNAALTAQLRFHDAQDDVLAKLGTTPSGVNFDIAAKGLRPAKFHEGGGCLELGNQAYLDITSIPQVDDNVLRSQVSFVPYVTDTIGFQSW